MIYLTEDSGPTTRDEKSHRITLSPKEYNFTGDLLVYGNKVAISTLKGKHISILIENREIAQTIRSLFDLLWNKAKKSPSR
jgi:hypothetical protein